MAAICEPEELHGGKNALPFTNTADVDGSGSNMCNDKVYNDVKLRMLSVKCGCCSGVNASASRNVVKGLSSSTSVVSCVKGVKMALPGKLVNKLDRMSSVCKATAS